MVARVKEVASSAKIDIKICLRCDIAAARARNVAIKKVNCTKIVNYKGRQAHLHIFSVAL